MQTVIEAFILIFTAELGDKSMLLAMTFATQFPLLPVLVGIFTGILANHGVAVLIGSQAGRLLPLGVIQPLSGALFLFFAFTGLKIEDDEEADKKMGKNLVLAVALAFFIGEFGDKTQLSAMTLASTRPSLLVLAGTVTAMMCTSTLSILLGARIGKKIPEVLMRIVSGAVFLLFGLIKLKGILNTLPWAVLALLLAGAYIFVAARFYKNDRSRRDTDLMRTAEQLKRQRELLEQTTKRMCLGQEKCGTCDGAACMVGYAKGLLRENMASDETVDVTALLRKQYPRATVREGLELILRFYETAGWDTDQASLQNRLRRVFETILYGESFALSEDAYFTKLESVDPAMVATLRNRISQTERRSD